MRAKMLGFIGILCLFLPLSLLAQTSLNVPNNVKNSRFYSDIFKITRPALSIAGFDDSGNHSKGYGLKQILEEVLNDEDQEVIDNYNEIVDISDNAVVDPYPRSQSLFGNA